MSEGLPLPERPQMANFCAWRDLQRDGVQSRGAIVPGGCYPLVFY